MPLVKKHNGSYEDLTPEDFKKKGMEILQKPLDGGSEKICRRRFVASFGATWITCAALWQKCLSSSDETFVADVTTFDQTNWKFDRKKPAYKPKHLLWALHFMKCYPTENQMASTVNEDEKTLRKWVWIFIDALAGLKSEVVSL